jgi:hypothetical protein
MSTPKENRVRVGRQTCTACAHVAGYAHLPAGRTKPRPGQFTVCANCAHLMIRTDDAGGLRDLTSAEAADLAADAERFAMVRERQESAAADAGLWG